VVIIAGFATALAFTAIPRISPPLIPAPTPTQESLSGKIEQLEVVSNPGSDTQVFILLSIENKGIPTGIHHYAIRIDHVTSKSFEYNGPLDEEIKGRYTLQQTEGRGATVIQPQDSIIGKTEEAIRTDRKVSGWLRLVLPAPEKVLSQSGSRYKVSFADASGNTYEAVYVVP
jgi:hypothetical protein